jgi:hypothetical protein
MKGVYRRRWRRTIGGKERKREKEKPGQARNAQTNITDREIGYRTVLCSSNRHELLDFVPLSPAKLILHTNTQEQNSKRHVHSKIHTQQESAALHS